MKGTDNFLKYIIAEKNFNANFKNRMERPKNELVDVTACPIYPESFIISEFYINILWINICLSLTYLVGVSYLNFKLC